MFVDAERREPVSLDLPMQPERLKLTCAYCKKKGACVQCMYRRCIVPFHVPCGLRAGAKFEVRGDESENPLFFNFCHKHRAFSEQAVHESPVKRTAGGRGARRAKVVLLATKLSEAQLADVQLLARKVRGVVANEYDDSVTHLVTGATLASGAICPVRTVKYFKSVLAGKWVLCFDWVKDSLSLGSLQPERLYVVKGDASGGRNGPLRALSLHKTNPLFKNVSVYLHGEMDAVCETNMRQLVTFGGGVIRSSLPWRMRAPKSVIGQSQWVVLSESGTLDDDAGAREFCAAHGIPVRKPAWVYDSISNFQLQGHPTVHMPS
jgi:hypothetical protein